MLACIAHDLRRGIEAHRLRIEQRRAEDVGVMALHPRRGIGDQCETRGVALGKAVGAETLDLLEGLFGEVAFITARDHAIDQLVAKMRNPARQLRSEEHTSELQSLMRTSYAAFCLKKKNK